MGNSVRPEPPNAMKLFTIFLLVCLCVSAVLGVADRGDETIRKRSERKRTQRKRGRDGRFIQVTISYPEKNNNNNNKPFNIDWNWNNNNNGNNNNGFKNWFG